MYMNREDIWWAPQRASIMNEISTNSQARINNELHAPLRLEYGSGENWYRIPRECVKQLKDAYVHCWCILHRFTFFPFLVVASTRLGT